MNVYKWFIAHTTCRSVWRVTYSDDKAKGRHTVLLPWYSARSLKRLYGGKMWIDYKKGYF